MVQGIFAVRLLGVIQFGVLGTITVFATTINKLTSFRMGELVIKYVGFFHENNEESKSAAVFKVSAITEVLASFLAFSLIIVLAPFGAKFFAKDPSLSKWFILYGLIILANMFIEASTGLVQYFDRFKKMAFVNVIQSIVTLILIIIAWWQKWGLLGVLVSYLIGKIIHAIGLTLLAFSVARKTWGRYWWKVRLCILKPHIRELILFGINTNINGSLSLITRDSIILWVSALSTQEQVGLLKFALALSNYIQIPMAPMPQATYPELSRASAKNNWKEFRYILKQGSRVAGLYSLTVALGLVVFGKLIIRWIYEPGFLPAYPGLLILLIGIVFSNTFYWGRSSLLSLGLAHIATRINVVVTIVTVIGYIILIPLIGHLGAAIMMSIANLLGNSFVVAKVMKKVHYLELNQLEQDRVVT